jgi:hypothetical protein
MIPLGATSAAGAGASAMKAAQGEGARMEFAVGFSLNGKAGHVVVDAEDALVAALKVKLERPQASITYVRRENKRGDRRHPASARRTANSQ